MRKRQMLVIIIRMYKGLPKISYAILLLATILGSSLALLPAPVFATTIGCGSTITASTTLKADIGPCSSSNGLNIGASNIVLNCAGHTISGSGPYFGIYLGGITGVTVKNCSVTGFTGGTLGSGGPVGVGFALLSSGNTLIGNTANDNYIGFALGSPSGNTLIGSTANGNFLGFILISSSYNTLIGNTANNNFAGFLISSNGPASSDNILKGNTANDNSLVGFFLMGATSNELIGNTANSNGDFGFAISVSSGNTLKGNTANSNTAYGYYDDSTGSGTAGTANFYKGNECGGNLVGGSSPSGLGSPQF